MIYIFHFVVGMSFFRGGRRGFGRGRDYNNREGEYYLLNIYVFPSSA